MGVAVNVTLVPEQIVVWLALMVIDGVRFGFTTIVIPLLVTLFVAKQVALLLKIQATMSPLTKVDELKVDELVPALMLFICH